jgi:hypothetical protein
MPTVEPRQAIWSLSGPLVVDLAARHAGFEFSASSTMVVARIRRADSPRAVRTATLSAEQRTLVPVAPGNGTLIISPVALRPSLENMGVRINELVNVGGFSSGQRCFLDQHRKSVLLKAAH